MYLIYEQRNYFRFFTRNCESIIKTLYEFSYRSISSKRRNSYKTFWFRSNNIGNSNEEMEDIMKIVKSLEESGLLIKVIIETIEK